MFGFGGSTSKLQRIIEEKGIDTVTSDIANHICSSLATPEQAHQFILEELDAASWGNERSRQFATNSGIPASDYTDSRSNSLADLEGPNGSQQYLSRLCMELAHNVELMVEFRLQVDDKIMRHFELGKYQPRRARYEITYHELKKLLQQESVLGALNMAALGIQGASGDVARKAHEALQMANELATIVGMNGFELANAIAKGLKEELLLGLIRQYDAAMGLVEDDEPWVDTLLEWADEQQLPELQPMEGSAFWQTGFPRDRQQLKQLECLHLASCDLDQIPAELGNLTRLQALSLADNNLIELPDELCNLEQLQLLDLNNNRLEKLPESIASLTKLEVLLLQLNQLEDLSPSLLSLRKLREIDLSGQRIHLGGKYSTLSKYGREVYQSLAARGVLKDRLPV